VTLIKDNLRYTKEHEWILIEGEVGTVGITDFAQGELGDVVYLELPEVGAPVTFGESFGTIEAVKAVAELYAPVTGTITEVNTALSKSSCRIHPKSTGCCLRRTMSN
jgi:glycine cleavage system H protein